MAGTTPALAATLSVPIYDPQGDLIADSAVDCFPGNETVVADAVITPIAGLHGAYAQNGIEPLDLATAVGQALLLHTRIAATDITALAVASSVPHTGTTFLGTSLRNRLGLFGVTRPLHVNALCAGGAAAMHQVIRDIHRPGGEGHIGLAIGADDQGVGRIGFTRNLEFRAILSEVLGRELPMRFELGHDGRGIPPEAFMLAVETYVRRHGVLPDTVSDAVLDSFWDTSLAVRGNMWDTAANIAGRFGFTTAAAAEMAAESHRRTWRAKDLGVFDGIVVTVPGSGLKFHENPVRGATASAMARGETAPGVTSQSSSKMGGAAAAVLLMSAAEASRRVVPVLAEVVGYSFSAVPADFMGLGPISAARGLLKYLNLTMAQMDHIEVNEAFAAVVDAFLQQPDFGLVHGAESVVYPDHVNPWGGAIATGHVMGAKFIEMVTLGTRFFELHPAREYVLCTLCGGGGQGAAMVLRNPRFMNPAQRNGRIRGGQGPLDQILPLRVGETSRTVGAPGAARMPRRCLLSALRERGYLDVRQTLDAIDHFVSAADGQHLLCAAKLDYVLATADPASLPPDKLLNRALDLVTIRTPVIRSYLEECIGVVGAGEMGYQLALDYARAGYPVMLADVDAAHARAGRDKIVDRLYDAVGKGLYTASEAAQILSRISVPTDGRMATAIAAAHAGGGSFELIVEAATENPRTKQQIFAELRAALGPTATTILATNSSSITAGQAGADVVFHYFNPLRAMGLVDGSFAEALAPDRRQAFAARLGRIAANQRKVFYPVAKDAPGSLVNPFFVATYFPGDMLSAVEAQISQEIADTLEDLKEPTIDEATRLEALRADVRAHAVALLDALYVEAVRGETRPLAAVLADGFDVSEKGALGVMLRAGGMGLFRLVDQTGGPHTFVECADNVAASPVYGEKFAAPQALREQDADWAAGRRRTWYPEVDKFGYDGIVRGRVAAIETALGEGFIRTVREKVHRQYWARVMTLLGRMFDAGLVSDDTAHTIENGTALGLGWADTPLKWLRAQPDMQAVRDLIAGEGLPVPDFFKRELAAVPAHPNVLLSVQDGVATLTINRPSKLNAIDQATVSELAAKAREVAADPSIHTVVLRGEGKNFVAGADILWFFARQKEHREAQAALKPEFDAKLAEVVDWQEKINAALDEIGVGSPEAFDRFKDLHGLRVRLDQAKAELAAIQAHIDAPLARIYDDFSRHEIEAIHALRADGRLLIVVTQGKNIGGGAEITAQGDFTIAVEGFEGVGTEFWFPEASLGIGVGYGGHVELVRRVGKGLALRYLITGAHFKTGEALATGYLNRGVLRHDLDGVLHKMAVGWAQTRGQVVRAGGDVAVAKAAFIARWTERRPATPELERLRRLWEDPFAVEAMVLGQVPPWLEGPDHALAEAEVAMILKVSSHAVRLLRDMVEQGDQADLRAGLTRIFGTDDAQMAIGAFARANARRPFRWPLENESHVADIVQRREAALAQGDTAGP